MSTVEIRRRDDCPYCGRKQSDTDVLKGQIDLLEVAIAGIVEYVGCLQPDECGGLLGTCRVCSARKLLGR